MMATTLQSLAILHLGGFRTEHPGGFVPLLLVAAVVGVAAWALARRDPVNS